jgi:L-phenylalanine/L-methionine N-acetyltransferase
MSERTGQVAGLVIRALEVEDAEALAELQRMPGFRHGTLRPPHPTTASVRKHLEQIGPDNLQLGAFLEERLVGNGGLHRFAGRRRHAAGLGMGVADDMSGRGIGSAVIKALLDAADNWLDIRRIELSVFVDNERAIRLYERHGFEREGLLSAYAIRDGAYVDAVAMARLRNT